MTVNVLRHEVARHAAAHGAGRAALPGLVEADPAPADWPLPDGPWRRPGACDAIASACQVQLDARRFVNGRLLAIDLRQGVVRWASAGRSDVATLRFSAFRCLRPMALVPAEPPDSLAWRPAPALVPFHVEFADGQVWKGSTFRSRRVDEARGLFVFEPVDEIGNLRLAFVPRCAWRSLSIGAPTSNPSTEEARVGANGREDLLKSVVGRAASRRLGQVLVDLGLIDAQQLQLALSAQRKHPGQPLGELLVREGLLTREGLALALAIKDGSAIGEAPASATLDGTAVARAPARHTERTQSPSA
jgi:hypothetical protein